MSLSGINITKHEKKEMLKVITSYVNFIIKFKFMRFSIKCPAVYVKKKE